MSRVFLKFSHVFHGGNARDLSDSCQARLSCLDGVIVVLEMGLYRSVMRCRWGFEATTAALIELSSV